jgi:hypothetical protein
MSNEILFSSNVPPELFGVMAEAFKQEVADAKYPLGATVHINWGEKNIFNYFYRLNAYNIHHTRNDMDFYRRHDRWEVIKSEHLQDFSGQSKVCYNLEPLDELDMGSYFLYFMLEQFLEMEVPK